MSRVTKAFHSLLPTGRAYAMEGVGIKILRDSLLTLSEGFCEFLMGVRGDLFEPTMREDAIIQYEKQFGIVPPETATLLQRQATITVVRRAIGGQGPGRLQEKLTDAGFNVVVVENIPYGDLLFESGTQFQPDNGGPFDYTFGATTEHVFGEHISSASGYLLGNGRLLKADGSRGDPVVYPEAAGAGQGPTFNTGSTVTFTSAGGGRTFGNQINRWAYVFTIEGPGGTNGQIPAQDRLQFEQLILRWRPAHLGVMIRVEYV